MLMFLQSHQDTKPWRNKRIEEFERDNMGKSVSLLLSNQYECSQQEWEQKQELENGGDSGCSLERELVGEQEDELVPLSKEKEPELENDGGCGGDILIDHICNILRQASNIISCQ